MSNEKNTFDLPKLISSFKKCRTTDGEILLQYYTESYEELNKFFGAFGTVFGFVTSDIVSKIKILEEHRNGEHGDKYISVQSMTTYEVAEKITISKTKLASGSRTLLRLHRALKFIILLLEKIVSVDSKEYMGSHAAEAYNASLAPHHTWIIRKMVGIGFRMLSTKSWILEKCNTVSEEECMTLFQEAISEAQLIYDIVQQIYEKNGLLQLP